MDGTLATLAKTTTLLRFCGDDARADEMEKMYNLAVDEAEDRIEEGLGRKA